VQLRSPDSLPLVLLVFGSVSFGCQAGRARPGVSDPADEHATENTARATSSPIEAESVGAGEVGRSTESITEEVVPESSSADTRDQQCNLLIDAVNSHLPQISAATARFDEAASNPSVIEQYEGVVQDAIDDLEELDIVDRRVVAFTERFVGVLRSSKEVGRHLLAAATDASLLPSVVAEADGIRETEERLVSDINGYCQDQRDSEESRTPGQESQG